MKILVSLNAISDSSHRQDLRKHSFDDYFEAQVEDDPVMPIVQILRSLATDFDIIVYTTMSEEYRLQVEDWLIGNEVPADEVLMRETGDYSKNQECVMELLRSVDKIQCVIENDVRLIETLRDDDYFVLETI